MLFAIDNDIFSLISQIESYSQEGKLLPLLCSQNTWEWTSIYEVELAGKRVEIVDLHSLRNSSHVSMKKWLCSASIKRSGQTFLNVFVYKTLGRMDSFLFKNFISNFNWISLKIYYNFFKYKNDTDKRKLK